MIATKERLLQHDFVFSYIQKRGKTDKINVMGSSKCMIIDSTFFNASFFNYYVSNSSFVEYLAITKWLEENEQLPDTLIMEISFSQFHNMYNGQPNYYFNAARSFANKNDIQFPELEGKPANHLIYKLFSFAYLLDNLQNINNKKYQVTKNDSLQNSFVLKTDGSLWTGQYLRWSKEKKKQKVEDPSNDKLNWVKSLDPKVKSGFINLISYLKNKGVYVILYRPPYHPNAYELYVKNNPLFSELNDFSRELAKQHQLELFGSFNPNNYELNDQHFYDALHLTKSGFKIIYNEHFN